ncbi:hypothetical protein F2Q69_00042181 [Brassica cretica]|uniref:Uncharacterized protein n=1 Tax=Brassica cretica TaxID=69181 RepID=A0A8S9NFL8_BRACR|nr:hypothetical protein F2Q69_00042181 [Brassica cretica]
MWEPGGSLFDPEIVSGPGGHVGTGRTRRSLGNPEVPSDPERTFGNPEVPSGSGGCFQPGGFFLTRRSFGNSEFPLDLEVVLNPGLYKNLEVYLFQAQRCFQDTETAWGPEAGILRTGVPPSGDPEAGVLPGQDLALVILRSQVEKLWSSDGVLETAEPGALIFLEKEFMC